MLCKDDFTKSKHLLKLQNFFHVFDFLNSKIKKKSTSLKNKHFYKIKQKYSDYLISEQTIILNFSQIVMNDQNCFKISQALLNLKIRNLVSLEIAVSVEKISIGYISLALSQFHFLRSLKIDFDSVVLGFPELSEALRTKEFLKRLEIKSNNKHKKDHISENISLLLSNLNHLAILNLNLIQNDIKSKGLTLISKALTNSQHLTKLTLSLRENNINSEGIESLSKALYKLRENLFHLNVSMSKNMIDFKGFSSFFETLISITTLRELKLFLNVIKFNYDVRSSLYNTLDLIGKKLTRLKLSLNDNHINDEILSNLCFSLVSCCNIKQLSLDLNQNLITNTGIKALSKAISGMVHIEKLKLYLMNNMIDITSVETIGLAISGLKLERMILNLINQQNVVYKELDNVYLQSLFKEVKKMDLIL